MMCSKTSSESYGNRGDDDYPSLCPKKQKHNNGGRRRVPRRGPGVAELEKIRLEEQHISTAAPLPPPPPLPEKSPNTIDRTGLVHPFSSYFTTGSFPNDLIPPAPVFQRKHDSSLHYLPPVNREKKNIFKIETNRHFLWMNICLLIWLCVFTAESTESRIWRILSVYRAPFKPNILPWQWRKGKKI